MATQMELELIRLRTQVERLSARVPVRSTAPPTAPVAAYIIGGQSLGLYNAITTYGITKYIGTLGSITTQTYSPGTVNATTGAETAGPSPAITAWPSGLGYGTTFGAAGYGRVIVVNDSRAGTATLLIGSSTANPTFVPSAMEGMVYSTRYGAVTLADGTTITALIPDFG
jgi:hypothetical protein